jgi:hypothetical protein
MGDFGSYDHYYKLNERIPELDGTSIVLDGNVDDLGGDCAHCGTWFDIGAEIVKGKVG